MSRAQNDKQRVPLTCRSEHIQHKETVEQRVRLGREEAGEAGEDG